MQCKLEKGPDHTHFVDVHRDWGYAYTISITMLPWSMQHTRYCTTRAASREAVKNSCKNRDPPSKTTSTFQCVDSV